MKLTNKQFKEFVEIAEGLGEYLFGTKKQIKEQAEMVFEHQGYWSGVSDRIYFDGENFTVRGRWE